LAAPLSQVFAGLKRLPAEVTALAAVAFMVALGFGVVAPAIPLFARHFGVSKTEASAVISTFAAARLLTAPFAGRLVNAFGERTMLATGIGIVGVSSLLAGLSADYWQLLVLRGVGGVGSIMFSVSASSLLIRVTPPHLRGRAQGVFAGGFLIGSIAGPVLGFVAVWSLRAPFFLYAGTLAVAGAIAWGALRHSELAARPVPGGVTLSLRAALRQRAYRATLLTNLAEDWAIVGARSAMVPLFVADRLALSSTWTYVGFFALSAVSGVLLMPFGKRADTAGRRPVLLIGLVLGVAGLACLPLVAGAAGLVAVMALLGVSGAALSVASGAMLGDVVGGRGGTVVAVYQMAGDLGTVIGPVVAGWLADAHGYGAAFGVAAAVVALPIPAVLAAPETAHVGASSEDAARTGTR
jgi:MFS transporter, DHA1 family, multidrug resistance protein